MSNAYQTVEWDSRTEEDCRWLLQRALREDLDEQTDWTSLAVTRDGPSCRARIVARDTIVVCGVKSIPIAFEVFAADLQSVLVKRDGETAIRGETVVELTGLAFDLLRVERTMLNVMGHLSGIATATAAYRKRVAGTKAEIYDTRKTLPGWRRLQKYAVHQGGGRNHRSGLFDGILIKDNHIALMAAERGCSLDEAPRLTLAEAQSLASGNRPGVSLPTRIPIEIEVDNLIQLENVLGEGPDIILLDNMQPDQLRSAVAARDRLAPRVILEASGGVNLETVAAIAGAGVDRISVGALTHSVCVADLGLDWD